MRFIINFFVIFTLSNTQVVFAEIKNKELLKNIFDGCIEEDIDSSLKIGQLFEYCACFTNKMSQSLTIEELMRLEFEAKQDEEKVFQNEKFSNAVIQCASNLYK